MLAKNRNDQTNWLTRRMLSVALAFVTGTALLLAGCDMDKGGDDEGGRGQIETYPRSRAR